MSNKSQYHNTPRHISNLAVHWSVFIGTARSKTSRTPSPLSSAFDVETCFGTVIPYRQACRRQTGGLGFLIPLMRMNEIQGDVG